MHSDVKVAKALAKEYPRRSIQMELAEWIGPFLYAIATFFLLYRQNKIMEEQNRIMREQVGTVPAAALAIPRPSLVQHWPMLVMAVLTTATWLALGLFFYLRKPVTVEKILDTATPAGQIVTSPRGLLKYVWIPSGSFIMGCSFGDLSCDADERSHPVTLSTGFWLGQTEVTVDAYKHYVKASGRRMPAAPPFNPRWEHGNQPIVNLKWQDAKDFCGWDDGRLPTEAEWEYAARGRSPVVRYGEVNAIAWYSDDSDNSAHDVAEKSPNYIGLYDTLGNAWEWVNDWWGQTYYDTSPPTDPPGPAYGNEKVLRGGSYHNKREKQRFSNRNHEEPTNARQWNTFGVRCARD